MRVLSLFLSLLLALAPVPSVLAMPDAASNGETATLSAEQHAPCHGHQQVETNTHDSCPNCLQGDCNMFDCSHCAGMTSAIAHNYLFHLDARHGHTRSRLHSVLVTTDFGIDRPPPRS